MPSGAIPKDGPSAGVTMVTALASELTGRPVRGDLAMTGEITLSGRVLPVGGIKEKVLAARRHGITEVILPRQNEKNIKEDLTEELRSELTIHYVVAHRRSAGARADAVVRRRPTPGCRWTTEIQAESRSVQSERSSEVANDLTSRSDQRQPDHRLHVDDLAAPDHVARVRQRERPGPRCPRPRPARPPRSGTLRPDSRKKTISSSQ